MSLVFYAIETVLGLIALLGLVELCRTFTDSYWNGPRT